jgi:hypothetical protein
VGAASVFKPIVVCQQCNSGWMSALEKRVRPILLPMVLGSPSALEPDSQECLATWLTKTALIHEHAERPDAVTTEADRRWFGVHQAPMPGARMWLARYVGMTRVFVSRQILHLFDLDDPARATRPHAMLFTVVYGHVALQAVLVSVVSPYPYVYDRPELPFASRFWPATERASWPPDEALDDLGLQQFAQMQPPPGVN